MKSNKTGVFVALLLLWFAGLVFFGTKLTLVFFDRRSDQNTMMNLYDSITTYHAENKRYPGLADHQANDIDLQSDYSLMVLLCPPPEKESQKASPTKSSFFAGKPAVKDPKTGEWQGGLQLDAPETGGLFDKRGNPFRIRLDGSGDGMVYSPLNNQHLPAPLLIWSAGRDGKFETWADNARSWK